jgi:transcriptional regulator with XRE-family HTH domain
MKRIISKPASYQVALGPQRDRLLVAMAIRMARAALGWSQAEFGRFLGMSQRAIHRIEQGHSEPRRTTLLAIESLLHKAGFKIEDRSDGGFCMVVPASMLGEVDATVSIAAPGLADFWPLSEESELAEPAQQH